MSISVQGYCPMGCGQTLFLADELRVTCCWSACPNPTAVDQILGDPETEHLVDFTAAGFTILHPLRERLDDDQGGLWGCALHRHIEALIGPPAATGRYRTMLNGAYAWTYERVSG